MTDLVQRLRDYWTEDETHFEIRHSICDEAADEIERLRERAEQAEADAGRYRWLRAQHWSDNTISAVLHPKDAMKSGHDAPSGARLDEAIDAAIAASQPSAEGKTK